MMIVCAKPVEEQGGAAIRTLRYGLRDREKREHSGPHCMIPNYVSPRVPVMWASIRAQGKALWSRFERV